jgi:hypothetical protein
MAVAVRAPLLDQQQVQLAITVQAQQRAAQPALDLQTHMRALADEPAQWLGQHFPGQVFRHPQA